jgi:hypothetical protein
VHFAGIYLHINAAQNLDIAKGQAKIGYRYFWAH